MINRKTVFDALRREVGPLTQEMVDHVDTLLDTLEELDAARDAKDARGVLRMSTDGLVFLCNLEACVLSAYQDVKSIWTIGVGHTKAAGPPAPKRGLKLTTKEAFALFREDVEDYEADVRRNVTAPLEQHEFDALVSFHYNTGAIARASVTKLINSGQKSKAGAALMQWVKPVSLKARRLKEKKLFETGDYGDVSTVTVFETWPGKGRRVSVDVVTELAD